MVVRKVTLQITKRDDGRFVTERTNLGGEPSGVDSSLSQAIDTAVREATHISKHDRCAVAIEIEQDNGTFKCDQIINPPLAIRRKPRPKKKA